MKKELERLKFWQIFTIILFAMLVIILVSNKTFLKTEYSEKIDKTTIRFKIPRYTYFKERTENKLVFRTIKKSEQTENYYKSYLGNTNFFHILLCENKEIIYYNPEQNFGLYNLEVSKKGMVKTIKLNYTTLKEEEACQVFDIK